MDLSETASGAAFDSSYLSDGFEALLRFNAETDLDAVPNGFYIHEVAASGSSNGPVTSNKDSAMAWAPYHPMQSAGLPSGNQSQQIPECTSEQPAHAPMDCAMDCTVDEQKYELDDFYNTPGLEWDPELLEVPTEEADNEVPSQGLAACASGPQCFNCGSSLEWDGATGLLVDCETCFCPN
ncbi:hypothetical protein PG988_013580 [Apiospora saccharicola]